jgi:hypothetical protein
MFAAQELVPPEIYNELGDRAVILCIDDRVMETLRQLRLDYGPVIVNDWKWGGEYRYRGYRPHSCKQGATWSQHRFGRAADCVFKDADVATVRADVLRKAKAGHAVYSMIRGIEDGVSWFHFDFRNEISIQVFRP